jgi:hypothetical protein
MSIILDLNYYYYCSYTSFKYNQNNDSAVKWFDIFMPNDCIRNYAENT